MFKGRGGIAYSIMKIVLYIIGYWEYLSFGRLENRIMQVIVASIIVANGFIRQLYIYEKHNLHRYGQMSIILEFVLGTYLAWLQPIAPSILLLTPTVFESLVAHTLSFGAGVNTAALLTLIAIDILNRRGIYSYIIVFRSIFLSYVLGYIIVVVISYLASMQFRERERMARANRELEQAYKKLLDNASKLQELSVEKERNRMAREIHDTLAHTLTTVVVQMEACKKLIDVDVPRAKAEFGKAQELTRAGLDDVKRTIKALRPQILENNSLTGALYNLVQDIDENAHVKVEFHESMQKELELSSSAEVGLFRVIQESITNAIRHGAAEKVDISITEKENMLNINISDNGRGCTHIKEGYGLKGISERIKGLSGTVQFYSTAGNGFHTRIVIPCKGGITSDS